MKIGSCLLIGFTDLVRMQALGPGSITRGHGEIIGLAFGEAPGGVARVQSNWSWGTIDSSLGACMDVVSGKLCL
jgi:hypothetical protein